MTQSPDVRLVTETRLPQLALVFWRPATAYAAGYMVVSPAGQIVIAAAAHTSGSTFDATRWTAPDGGTVLTGGGGQPPPSPPQPPPPGGGTTALTVVNNGDGTADVAPAAGSTAVVVNNADGTGTLDGTVVNNGDGTATI